MHRSRVQFGHFCAICFFIGNWESTLREYIGELRISGSQESSKNARIIDKAFELKKETILEEFITIKCNPKLNEHLDALILEKAKTVCSLFGEENMVEEEAANSSQIEGHMGYSLNPIMGRVDMNPFAPETYAPAPQKDDESPAYEDL